MPWSRARTRFHHNAPRPSGLSERRVRLRAHNERSDPWIVPDINVAVMSMLLFIINCQAGLDVFASASLRE